MSTRTHSDVYVTGSGLQSKKTIFDTTAKALVAQIGSPEDIWDFERANDSLHSNDNRWEDFLNGLDAFMRAQHFNGLTSAMYTMLVYDLPGLASTCVNGGYDAVIINNGGGDISAENAAVKQRVDYVRAQAKLPPDAKVIVWNWPHWLKKRATFTFNDAKFIIL